MDKQISELPKAAEIKPGALLVMQQDGAAQSVDGDLLIQSVLDKLPKWDGGAF